MLERYTYAYGYRARWQAEEALEDGFASGDLVAGEFPKVEGYTTTNGKRRYRITLLH